MRAQKGEAGYIRTRKFHLTTEIIFSFAIVIGLVVTGYIQTKTRLNWLTLIAVLGCLPACRMLVNLIMLIPHHSVNESKELEISGHTEYLTVLYDLIITSERRSMPITALVISGSTICGYAPDKKVDVAYAARHIKAILKQNQIEKVTVKVFHDYVAFLSRAEGLNSIAVVEGDDNRELEEAISEIILDISL